MVTATTTTTTITTQMTLLQDPQQQVAYDASIMAQLPFHDSAAAPKPKALFSPTDCLFCSSTSNSLEGNYQHMRKVHGLFIPDQQFLLVDLETLFEYLHLIIFQHMECLYCHTSRRTIQAVQQHMMSRGHCKFDISKQDSEFRDFYDYNSSEFSDDSEIEETRMGRRSARPSSSPVQVDSHSLRLPSGRIVSDRSSPARHPSRKPLKVPSPSYRSNISMVEQTTPEPSASDDKPSSQKNPRLSSKALKKQDRKAATLSTQLSSLRASDQKALAHLPASEQRVILAQALRAEAQSERSQRHFRSHMDSLGNLISKERWISDVPGGPRHKNRFMHP